MILANLPQSFQILDTQDQLSSIKRVYKQFGIDDERFPPKQMQWFIGGCKEDGLRPSAVPAGDDETRKKIEIYQLYEQDRAQSMAAICGEICHGPGLREAVVVSWLNGHAWLVADLHNRNIMRDQHDAPTIIDALIGPVTPAAYLKLRWLQDQVADAKGWRSSGKRSVRKKWHEDYDEADI